jgi:hypothetical protein
MRIQADQVPVLRFWQIAMVLLLFAMLTTIVGFSLDLMRPSGVKRKREARSAPEGPTHSVSRTGTVTARFPEAADGQCG